MRFIPGIELSQGFYFQAVQPLLANEPPHAAALLGGGSDVLGFDTPMSMDHGWGPQVQLFFDTPPAGLVERLAQELPREFAGIPVFVGYHEDGSSKPEAEGTDHRVTSVTWGEFSKQYLGLEEEPGVVDWLRVPSQRLRTVSTGPIFHDGIGLQARREVFAWYPDDVWRYLLACGWQRIGQEEALVARAGFVGDELGAKLIAGRLVRDVMRTAFLLERQHAPYAKWFGTAFRQLRAAERLGEPLDRVLRAESWKARDGALVVVYEILAELQNASGLCEPRPAKAGPFHGRPFRVIEGTSRFADALLASISDPEVRAVAERTRAGSIDQISDNTDLLENVRADLDGIWR